MADPFIAEIRIFPFNFAPRGWAWCNGQTLPIVQNTALFSLLGTTYGGDGRSTFALPDLRGRTAMAAGTGPGLTPRGLGDASGSATVTLLESEVPAHTHGVLASAGVADLQGPGPTRSLARSSGGSAYRAAGGATVAMAPQALAPAGGGLPHNNLQPYLTCHFNIALQGVFPSRS